MKKLFSIILIPVFLIATTIGVASSVFYCKDMDKMIEKACCDDIDKGGCCNSKPEIKKVKDDFLNTQIDVQFFTPIELTESYVFDSIIYITTDYSFYTNSSPPYQPEELYILNCSLII